VCTRRESRILRYGVSAPARPDPFARFELVGRDGLAFARASFGRLAHDSLDCGASSRIDRKTFALAAEGRRLAAPRVTDRPRLVGWSSLCLARRRRLTSLVVVAGTTLPDPLVPAPQLVRVPVPHGASTSGLTRVTKTAPQAVPSGTKRATVGTPSVVSRSTGLPQTPSRACLVDRECHAATHTVLTPRLTPAACVSTPCGAPLGQRRAADLPCGSSCGSDARCVGPTSAFSLLRTSTRASWAPEPVLPGESPGSRQVGFASADRTVSAECSSREALSSSRDVCGRASDIRGRGSRPGPASLARLVPCPRAAKTASRSTA